MYLLLNPSGKNRIRLVLFDESRMETYEKEGRNRDLLLTIDECLRAHHLSPDDVKGIMTVVGAGGFTSTRIATTIANAFGFVRHIPLLAVSLDESKNPQTLIPRLLAQPNGQYVSAAYSGEANVTEKRNK